MTNKKARTQATTDLKNYKKRLVIVLIINTTILVIVGILGISTRQIQKAMHQMEIKKVGGEKNYQYAQQIYESKNYQKEQEFLLQQQYKIYIQSDKSLSDQ